MKIDLNCDLGESFGRYALGNDAGLMPFITSANIACGFHAGDPGVMGATVRLAKQHGVAVGAHPGWPDLQGFGRRVMQLSPAEVEALVLYQIGALAAFAKAEGLDLHHVKPHGALYNQAAAEIELAQAIARGVKRFSPDLILIGLAGSRLVEAGSELGLGVANEAFPDRAYNPDGTLKPRGEPGALLDAPEQVAEAALRLAREGVRFADRVVPVETLCLHGDNPDALENARLVQEILQANRIELRAL